MTLPKAAQVLCLSVCGCVSAAAGPGPRAHRRRHFVAKHNSILHQNKIIESSFQHPLLQLTLIKMHRNIALQSRQNELFVGNLSYFCTEADLYNLFANFGVVQTLRIKHNDKGTRSLQFGFVCLSNLSEAEEARRVLNGAMVMGRNIK